MVTTNRGLFLGARPGWRDPPGAAAQPRAVLADDQIGQGIAEPGEGQRRDGVLEGRQGGLRGQRRAGDRIALEQEIVHGIVGQPRGVVDIRMAPGQPEQPVSR
jgi:hypothetical protein